MDNFEDELKRDFLKDFDQLLAQAEQAYLELESNPNDPALIDKVFRIAHNIKGGAKAVGFDQLGLFAHEFENYLLKIKNKKVDISQQAVNLLLRCNDQIQSMVEALKTDFNAQAEISGLLEEIKAALEGRFNDQGSPPSAADEVREPAFSPAPEVQHDAISPDEIKLLQSLSGDGGSQAASPPAVDIPSQPDPQPLPAPVAEPVSAAPIPQPANPSPVAAKPSAPPAAGASAVDESIRVSLTRLERLLNYVGELSILQTVLMEQVYGSNPQLLRTTAHQLEKVGKEVQDISMSLRMVPVKQTFQKMQRIVRDTANALGKKVQLHLSGEETELDKTVLDAVGAPLVHLIRNAVDHGIESSEDRVKAQKSEGGNVKLRALHQAGKLVIEVEDDGGGINGQKLLGKAIEKGILRPGTKMEERDAIKLIFHPGFSTKTQVSEVSGRGVGMDVVKTNIEHLQGEVQVETTIGKGTTFRILLPLTLAIVDAMVIECGRERYVVPLSQIHESIRPKPEELHKLTGVGEGLQLRGEVLPAFRLSTLLGAQFKPDKNKNGNQDQIALVFRNQGKPFALLVDDVIKQQQVVIKRLGKELQGIKGYSGSAILGDGRPALILEVFDLLNHKVNSGGASQRPVSREAV